MLIETVLINAMSALDRHPALARLALRPLANAPVVSKLLKVVPRAYMGATAFEIHDVDVGKGRISIGGVDEVIFSSKFLELFHGEIAAKVGEDEKDAILYRVGRQGGYWEVDEALRHGRWAPKVLVDLVETAGTIDTLRRDPKMARFFTLAMKMVLRLIINEGGWGTVDEMDFTATPIRVTMSNSQEARWGGPSDKPTCAIATGVFAGYTSRILGEELHAKEIECQAMGAQRCVFEIDR